MITGVVHKSSEVSGEMLISSTVDGYVLGVLADVLPSFTYEELKLLTYEEVQLLTYNAIAA